MHRWDDNWYEKCAEFKQRCFRARREFLAGLKKPLLTQKRVLADIVTKNSSSLFGKKHRFAQIKTVEDFQRLVPIRNYQQFEPWIAQEVKWKGSVLGAESPERWLQTSGSTGNSKKIPYTKYWMEKYRVPALEILWANYLKYAPDLLEHPFATLDTQTVRDKPTEFLNGIPYQGITNRNDPLTNNDWQPPWYDAPWFTADVPVGYDARMYHRLRHFLGRDLRAILTINPSTLIALQHHLLKNSDMLLQDIINGTLDGKRIFVPNPGLARKIAKSISQPEFSFKDLWPNLKLISCWTSASAKLYLPKLEKLFPGVKILPFMSCGTEGIVTLPMDDHFVTGPLAITQGFYEFLPASVDLEKILQQGQGVKALLFNELELEKEYHLIMTQGSGMCRYAVGDIYKVTEFYKGVPRIEYSRRNGSCFSFTGEKITEQQLVMAVEKVVRETKIDGGLFLCCPVWGEPPYYKILIEVANGQLTAELNGLVAVKLDNMIREINDEYDSKRKSDRLAAIEVILSKKGSIEQVQERQKLAKNATQFKYKPFQANDTMFNQVLEAGDHV